MLSPIFKSTILIAIGMVILPASGQIQVIRPDVTRIRYPCHNDDLQCIKRVFKGYGWCDSRYVAQSPSKPLKISDTVIGQLPVDNVTIVQKDYVITGFGAGQVEQFYINPVTDKAVLVVNYENTVINPNTVILYHRTGKEDIQVIAPKASEQYPGLKITTIISGLRRYPELSSFVEFEQDVVYGLGDGVQNITDPDVLTLLNFVNEHVGDTIKELFISRVDFLADYYVQNIICHAH